MQTLPPECVAHVLCFLDAKSALCFSETASLYNEIVANNKNKVQNYVIEKKDENHETVLSVDMFGLIHSSETTKEIGVTRELFGKEMPFVITTTSKGTLFKQKMHGFWDDTVGFPSKQTRSFWVNGKLIYTHILMGDQEFFANPVDNPGKDTFAWKGHSLRVSFWRVRNVSFVSCGDEEHPAFCEAVDCSPLAFCCQKHQNGLPAPLFPQVPRKCSTI
ncbi:hypothetical protein LAU_0031 [Lausannevirus]|uniref:F-box domain-containing protein n=2 Tax=Lausannevirus TaxID=999883 RepID=A0A0N9PLR7_9VIRU|nr:hypothetical protein LAU_0031 [Lausannevirus]AEA06887.1 hypothetical protein LAU_0031 [Lausannevirus]ALH06729.1 hypothetical protein PMV_031 [Port-miou virus]